jgi:hypothetical protein
MIRHSALLLSILLTIGGCQPDASPDADGESSLKLFVFNCGMLRFNSIESFSVSNYETDVRDLIVPCYVVEHEKGRLLWDGGLPSKTAEIDGWQGECMLSRLDSTLS